jgi:hypothetical protein
MENLSLEGLTPEQIKLLESVADGFRVAKKEDESGEPDSRPTKFYRIISYDYGGSFSDYWGATLNFIAKINSDDLNIETIHSGSPLDELIDELEDARESEDFDIVEFISEWDEEHGDCHDREWTRYTEIDEITEDEYKDSDKWKKGSLKCNLKIELVAESFTKTLIHEEGDDNYYNNEDDEDEDED